MVSNIIQRPRRFYFMIIFGFYLLPLSAQKLAVESLESMADATAMMDEYALQYDGENYAGIVKVFLPLDDVEFDGGGVLKCKKMARGEYWVWMAKDSSRLMVRASGFVPFEVSFRNYPDVNIVHSKATYKLVITVPSKDANPSDNKGILAIQVEPKSALLYIDGVQKPLQDGQYSELVPKGTYRYQVESTGYVSQSGSIKVDEHSTPLKLTLHSSMSTLQVSCPTPGAQIYVDNQLRGPSPQTFSLTSGSHRIEARLDGYKLYREDITVRENDSHRIDIPALVKLTGKLVVNYLPFESDIYVDGQKLGVTPGTFRDVSVGSHWVVVRKDGYQSARMNAVVKANETAELSGSLVSSESTDKSDLTSSQTGIKGHVVFSDGDDAIGAVVMVKGTNRGTITDIEGNFCIDCQPGDKLEFKFVGYKTRVLKASNGMEVKLHKKLF